MVGADGTIDWWCPGAYQAAPLLSRLLVPDGGAVSVSVGGPPGELAYVPGTMVLSGTLQAAAGAVSVVDLLPWEGRSFAPPGRLVRVVTALRGPAPVRVTVHAGRARSVSTFGEGMVADRLTVRTGHPFAPSDHGWVCAVDLAAGDSLVVTLDVEPADPLSPDAARRLVDRTATAWRAWLAPAGYGFGASGLMGGAVERSLLLLGSLTQHGSSAVLGAATTSLPDHIGGERNQDHRWAWTADACAAVGVYDAVGLVDEAVAVRDWVRRLVADGMVPVPAVADPGAGPAPEEEVAAGVPGYRGSEPVRLGPYGAGPRFDHVAAVARLLAPDMVADTGTWGSAWPALEAQADWLADHWSTPDRGRWGVRGEPRRWEASAVAAASGLARLAALARSRSPLDLSAPVWRQAGRAAERWASGRIGHELALADAALLRLAWEGPWPVSHPPVAETVDRVLRELSSGPFVARYSPEFDDGAPSAQGASLEASLWAVRAEAAMGRWEAAHERLERVVGWAGELGILSVSADPVSLESLGDRPHAGAHIALVEAVQALATGPA